MKKGKEKMRNERNRRINQKNKKERNLKKQTWKKEQKKKPKKKFYFLRHLEQWKSYDWTACTVREDGFVLVYVVNSFSSHISCV